MRMRHYRQLQSAVYRYGLPAVLWAAVRGWWEDRKLTKEGA